MSTENTIVEPVDVDLDTFSADFFGQKDAEAEKTNSESNEDESKESDAQNEDEKTQTDENDTLDTEDEDEEAQDEEATKPNDDPKPKKNRFQERIDELNGKFREEQRQRQALEAKIAELAEKQNTKDEKAPIADEASGPSVDEKNEDGSDKYPLGEFDPTYIRDLTKHTLRMEREALRAEDEKEVQQKQFAAEREALQQSWTEKLGPAQERYPDFHDKGEQLFDTFAGIDQSYGEYLTATLMSMDYGPDVLYYLANNIDEANKIVAGGPTKATIALGRLESKFADAEVEKQLARPKVSKAPPPPNAQLKGTNAVVTEVPDDTDDLDAFSKKFFKKK